MLIVSVWVSVVAAFITWFLLNRRVKKLQDFVSTGLTTFQDEVGAQLKPVLDLNSKAMSIIGTQGAEVKKVKAAEKMIATGLMDDNKLVMDGVRQIFPKLGDYLDENPEVVMDLLPRLKQMYTQVQGNELSGQSRKHPFSTEE